MIRSLPDILSSFLCRIVCATLLLFCCLSAQAHNTYLSRDNHAGISSYASSWEGQAPVISNEVLITNAGLVVRGYLIHGTDRSRANFTFDGATATLVVEDTLRIHGNLTMKNGSSIHIKPGGVLIVQMAYYQDANVIFKNEGIAVFLDSWTTGANPTATTNTGSMYVAGTVTASGSSITIKPYTDLPADSPDFYEFSGNHVVKAEDCAGNNAGNVSFSEAGATILHWEISTDLFRTKTIINNNTGTQSYSNLTKITSYKAWYRNSSGVEKYSPGSTIVVLGPAKGGTLSGTTAVCEGTNTVNLTLRNYLGEIVQWESSPDNFITVSSTTLSSSQTFSFSDLSRKMYYRVLVKNGTCSQTYSAIYAVDFFANSQGGTIGGSATVCKGSNSGKVILSGHTGIVVRWESSEGSAFTSVVNINSTATEISYLNLSATTYYRAVVKNGPCSEAYSVPATITVSEVTGGTLAGTQPFCTGDANATLTLSGYTGSIIHWESSTDHFLTYQGITHTSAELVAPAPLNNTKYRVLLGNGGICANVYSAEFELTGNPSLNGGILAVSKAEVPVESPSEYFPLSGNADNATGNGNDGIVYGAVPDYDRFGMANRAYSFDGVDDIIATTTQYLSPGPQVFTISLWFKTTETTGGKLVGFGESQTGWSTDYDRHIYMDDQGQLYFGVYTDGNVSGSYAFIQSPLTYNDGQWHQAVGMLSAAGLELYVDGELKVKDETVTVAQEFSGFWRLGGDSMGGWPEAPTHPKFEGQLDDVYIYSRALSPAEISKLYGEGTDPLCAGETLSLQAATVPGATYTWAGPNSFSSAMQNPFISNITSAHGGTYFVKIDLNGCVIEGNTLVTITPVTVPGEVLSDQSNVCTGDNTGTLSLVKYTGQVIRWESSADDFMNDIQVIAHTLDQLTFTNITDTTSYRAIVKSGDCGEEMASVAAKVVADAGTVGGSISGSTVVCKDSNSGTLILSGHTGTIIQWESASTEDFSAFTIINSTSDALAFGSLTATTWYRAKVKSGTCGALYSASALVEVREVAGGSAAGNATVCEGSNSGTVTLSGYTGEIIHWESSVDNFETIQLIANTSAQLSYLNLSTTTSYRAVIGNGGICPEVVSSTVLITVDLKASGGTIVADQNTVCSGTNSGTLSLQNYAGEIIRWESSVDNFATITTITNTTASLTFQNLTAVTAFRAVVSGGACGEVVSEAALITVEAPAEGGKVIADKNKVCAGENSFTLYLQGFTGDILRWERSVDAFISHQEEISHTLAELLVTDIAETSSYRAVVKSGSCSEVFSAFVTVTAEEPAAGGLVTGGKRILPGENRGTLELINYDGTILYWESSADDFLNDIQRTEHSGALLTYENLKGSTWYRAVVQNNTCDPVYSAKALLAINQAPLAADDVFETMAGEIFYSEAGLTDNDSDPDQDPVQVKPALNLVTLAGNELDIEASGKVIFRPGEGFSGTDSLRYELCDLVGEASLCSYGLVVFHVREKKVPIEDLVVYKGLSPNMDHKNDKWFIKNIEYFPDNNVQIFNAGGILVFEMQGYDNAEKAFEGVGNRGSGSSGKELPEATYYYRIYFAESQTDLKGYVILNR